MEGNMDLIKYGERIAPRDVPTSDRQLPHSEDAGNTQSNHWDEELYVAKTNVGAVQFARTGDKRLDQALAEARQFVYAASMAGKLRTVEVEEGGDDTGRSSGEIEDKTKDKRQVPALPPLPDTPGFEPTGDPLVDEGLLWEIVKHRTNTDEVIQLAQLFEARCAVISARREMALDRCCDVAQRRAVLQKEIDAEEADEAESNADIYPASDPVSDPSDEADDEAEEKTDVSSNKDSSEL
ncbi:hypothetical protein BD413DRAFT_302069 [Trametes elegans]|nr:hypothetical protein BD413DRAFT_302069 [Trametes elegans]